MAEGGQLIFISGGVRSGKSSFAEKTAMSLAKSTHGNLHYIASGVAFDAEMKDRINRHQVQRNEGEQQWTTWEEPYFLHKLSTAFQSNDIVLFDCLTNLLNNRLFQTEERLMDPSFHEEIKKSIMDGILTIQKNCHTLIVVSNEILNEPIFSNDLVLVYAKLLGRLNQQVVSTAKEAYLVEAGIPICMKMEGDDVAFCNRRGL
ncbi:bifunctional adenosylcobinamide kinase/adenosylcobinamide-phosphate guanylyltransferase [Robertmurraya korlensis]|uniref:bifunctional adenosylcobinamide kinase/adenosylcobinamide-phosphate guanylyltransferase n=1 Tax=Robertmurraya korlensis TaxID=519977 RepID=UPI0008244E1C|nr:bifunctional adenosylcobinamide kinase/adenosylcobinamide-phosphate guanylyltransferase [Robertmurraya korlensis]